MLAITYGVVGFVVIERFSFIDALFTTVSTITTVGYGFPNAIGTGGKAFTMSLIVFGVIGFLYTFGVLVEGLTTGRWQAYRRYRRMDAQLRALRDHVIVCGYGRTGKQVVSELDQAQQPYVVVEMNPQPLEDVRNDHRLHVVGDAANDEVLTLSGIDRAQALVSAVDSDERNVYIVLTARSLNPRLFIVARSSYAYSVPKLERAGANRVVSPYTLSGHRMAALALQPAVVDVLDIVMTGGAETMAIEELLVPDGAQPRLTAGSLRPYGAVLLAARAGGALTVGPDDAHPLGAGDLVVAMGTRDQLNALASALRPA
ncbi:MAG: potassium channel family protein [Chloroflexi bacterium]|nr:MAG: potassium channel family protein [Chloroflexota bacterium]